MGERKSKRKKSGWWHKEEQKTRPVKTPKRSEEYSIFRRKMINVTVENPLRKI